MQPWCFSGHEKHATNFPGEGTTSPPPPDPLLPRKQGENSKNCKCAHRKLSHCRGAPHRTVPSSSVRAQGALKRRTALETRIVGDKRPCKKAGALFLMMRPVVNATSARICVATITHFHCRPMRFASVALARPHPRWEDLIFRLAPWRMWSTHTTCRRSSTS